MDRRAFNGHARVTRRKAIGGGLVALTPLLFPGRLLAQGQARPADSFVLLLKGLYQPVVTGLTSACPRSTVSDGSY